MRWIERYPIIYVRLFVVVFLVILLVVGILIAKRFLPSRQQDVPSRIFNELNKEEQRSVLDSLSAPRSENFSQEEKRKLLEDISATQDSKEESFEVLQSITAPGQ